MYMPPAAKGSALGTRQDLPALDPVLGCAAVYDGYNDAGNR